MRTIIGLGNPGEKYKNNRHNAGHMFIDFLRDKFRMTNDEYRIVKTDCYMNRSGTFVKKQVRNSPLDISNLYIAHDDLDIPFGSFKIQFATGPKVHNGIASVEEELGTDEFWRIRIGVDSRQPDDRRRMSGEEYVLSDFTPEERTALTDVFSKIYSRISVGL